MFQRMQKFFSHLLFFEASPLIRKARHKIIDPEDMLALPPRFDPRETTRFEQEVSWKDARGFLLSSIWASRRYSGWAYLCCLLGAAASLASPLLIHRFISGISAGFATPEAFNRTLWVGVLMGICGFLSGFIFQHYFYFSLGGYQNLTNILNKRIFSHSLHLSKQARQKSQVGDIVNHMSSDSDAIADFPFVLGDFLWAIVTIIGVSIMLFYYIGLSALAALALLVVLAPLTKYIAKKFTKLDEEMMEHRDRRVTLMTQTLNAIRVVKFFAWEQSVTEEVDDVRGKELHSRRKLARAEVIATLAYMAVSTLVLFVALAVHAWRGGTLDAATVFTCVSLFGLLEDPFGNMSRLISRTTTAMVSANRILNFLKQEEVDVFHENQDHEAATSGVQVEDLTVYYDKPHEPVLSKLNFQVRPGESLAVVGPVGCGKSSLLLALMGEIRRTQGRISFSQIADGKSPRFAYVPQEAYIINSTLLENITFGTAKVSGEELRKSLHTSCLDKDLREWKAGLRTEIGEKGVNLSGGQKQRVGLARAYVSDPQVIFLDDPLSAVDVETERLLCDRLIFGAWKEKTRLVVTHRLESLHRFDRVIFIADGEIKAQGRLQDLLAHQDFRNFYSEHGHTQGEKDTAAAPAVAAEITLSESTTRITEDEERETGAVKSSVYWSYIRALGGDDGPGHNWILFLLFFGAVTVTLMPILQQWWLAYYSAHMDALPALTAVGIYGGLGLLVLLGTLLNKLFWLDRGIRAGQSLHDKMLKSILNATIRFFDSTPVGRIIQRFSRDIESVDIYLQWSFEGAVHVFLQVISSLFLILGVLPMMTFIAIPVMAVYYWVQNAYRRPAREAKRFDSIARSPRYAHFKETLLGLVVIRAYGKTEWFMQEFYDRLAYSNRMFFNHYMLNRWFSSRIPLVGGLISVATAVTIVYSAKAGYITPGLAGLVSIYSLGFWGSLNWAVRVFSDIESRMTSIERLRYFADLPPEQETLRAATQELRATWPERGEVVARDIQVRYASHLPLVLKGISFEVKAGSRVGIVGRTGSGKSTLFQTLFRFIELESGAILIDGVDIATVPLARLRRSLAIVPQDPTLFMGTIRNNLDRYDEYTDLEIRAALEKASLWNFISSLPQGLQSAVTEGGQNLSQGQRQLLCLARALLTKAKVIVMDEATASVDVQTDAILQRVIRESLQGVTLLIIAHRLGTVADSDQIIEIADGLIKSAPLIEA